MRACHGRDERDRPTIRMLLDHDFLKPWKRTSLSSALFFFSLTSFERTAEARCLPLFASAGTVTPKIERIPPGSTAVSLQVMAQLVEYIRKTPDASAEVSISSPPTTSFFCVR
jgi:hypothetical protein